MEEKKIHKNYLAPAVTFCLRTGRITIFRATLSVMAYPEFYRFLYNCKDRLLAIEPCEMNDPGAYAFTGVKKDDVYDIGSTDLIRMLYRDNGWNEELTYRVPGKPYSGERVVEFDLTSALEIIEGKVVIDDCAHAHLGV